MWWRCANPLVETANKNAFHLLAPNWIRISHKFDSVINRRQRNWHQHALPNFLMVAITIYPFQPCIWFPPTCFLSQCHEFTQPLCENNRRSSGVLMMIEYEIVISQLSLSIFRNIFTALLTFFVRLSRSVTRWTSGRDWRTRKFHHAEIHWRKCFGMHIDIGMVFFDHRNWIHEKP